MESGSYSINWQLATSLFFGSQVAVVLAVLKMGVMVHQSDVDVVYLRPPWATFEKVLKIVSPGLYHIKLSCLASSEL